MAEHKASIENGQLGMPKEFGQISKKAFWFSFVIFAFCLKEP